MGWIAHGRPEPITVRPVSGTAHVVHEPGQCLASYSNMEPGGLELRSQETRWFPPLGLAKHLLQALRVRIKFCCQLNKKCRD